MSRLWGMESSSEDPQFGPDRWHAVVLLIAAVIVLGVLRYADAKQRRPEVMVQGLYIEPAKSKISLLPSLAGYTLFCDDLDGPCVSARRLREIAAEEEAARRQREGR